MSAQDDEPQTHDDADATEAQASGDEQDDGMPPVEDTGFATKIWLFMGCSGLLTLIGSVIYYLYYMQSTPVIVKGRPFRDNRQQPQASDHGSSQVDCGPALGAELSDQDRQQLARAWCQDAALEQASVAAFAHLTLELMELGAPPSLLQDCQRAAGDELKHAELCYQIASRYAGQSVQAGALRGATRSPRSLRGQPRSWLLARLALESYWDGCVNEGIATAQAEYAYAQCQLDELKQVLGEILCDERRHCELAWDIVDWCLREGGEVVRSALARSLNSARRLPYESASSLTEELSRRHGQASSAEVHERTQGQAQARLLALLQKAKPQGLMAA